LAAHPLQDGSGHRDALWTIMPKSMNDSTRPRALWRPAKHEKWLMNIAVVDNGANDDAAAAAAILA